jgi:hypothetical protein
MCELIGNEYVLEQVGFVSWQIELGDKCNVDRGRTPTTRFWWMRCGNIVLATPEGKPSVTLRKSHDGIWEGRTVRDKRQSVRLIPKTEKL